MIEVDARVWGFMSPAMQRKILDERKREERRLYKELLKLQTPVPWEDTKLKYTKYMLLDGDTYRPHTLWEPKPVPLNDTKPREGHCHQIGQNWFYTHQLWKAGTGIKTASGRRKGVVFCTKDVNIPVLIRAGAHSYEVWMSLTPMEVMTQKRGYQLAQGTVLVGGLGLGWFLRRVCEKKTVERVIVVEKDPDLFTAIRERLLELFPGPMQKVSDWVCGDVYDYIGKFGPETRHLLDIWDSYDNADRRFNEAHKKVKHLWGWGIFADSVF